MVRDFFWILIHIDLSTEDSVLSHLRPQWLDLKVSKAMFFYFHGGGKALGQSTV